VFGGIRPAWVSVPLSVTLIRSPGRAARAKSVSLQQRNHEPRTCLALGAAGEDARRTAAETAALQSVRQDKLLSLRLRATLL